MKLASPWVTTDEVAERLRVHKITVYRLIASGQLHPLKVGRILRFDAREIDAVIARGKETVAAEHHLPTRPRSSRR